jgi:hypothetical protein
MNTSSATPTSNLTHLDEPTMESKTSIFCWVHGGNSSFSVDIDPEKTIGRLKEAIVAKKPNGFGGIDPDELKLYVAKIRETKEAMGSFTFAALNVLRGSEKINLHFREGFPGNIIHFAIKRPGKQHSFILSTHIC